MALAAAVDPGARSPMPTMIPPLLVSTSFAGALFASSEPELPPATPGPDPPPLQVRFQEIPPGTEVSHRLVTRSLLPGPADVGASSDFEALCKAPCAAPLQRGIHEFALTSREGRLVVVHPAQSINDDSTFAFEAESKAHLRRAGWWILGTGFVLGIATTGAGLVPTCGSDVECQKWASLAIWGGVGLSSISALIAIPLVTTDDDIRMRLVATPTLSPPERIAAERGVLTGSTGSLVGRF